MRFKIKLNLENRQRMLPMDYQYYIGAWIYKIIGNADREFAQFLHSEGYKDGNKSFKFFNYSPLVIGRPILWKEKSLFEVKLNTIELQVSFLITEIAEKFIIGLFNNQEVYIGDRFNGLDLKVVQVERLTEPIFNSTMNYKATSPVVISYLPEDEKHAKYLSPNDDLFDGYLIRHILQKFNTLPYNKTNISENEIAFKLQSEIKSKLTTIKPYTSAQSKIRGYKFYFELKAPIEVHKMIYGAGFGEKNSVGFGWCEVNE
ncbi:MAG: CRISPR-associated endoribonuclease Cas6 [Bacteroidota bacterium]